MPWDSFVIISFAFGVLAFAHIKQDMTSFFFSMALFVLGGLSVINTTMLGEGVGVTLIFFGIYIGLRASIEHLSGNFNGIKFNEEVLNGRRNKRSRTSSN